MFHVKQFEGRRRSGQKFFRIFSKLARRSDPFSCCPGRKAGVEAKKAGARIEIRGAAGFFSEANALLPGQGTNSLWETTIIPRASWKKAFNNKPGFLSN
jgi:hypothetical protein